MKKRIVAAHPGRLLKREREALSKEEIDLLMREYLAMRSEIVEFVRYYRAHARYSGIFLGAILALVSLAVKSDSGVALAHTQLFWFSAGIVITTIVAYFVFDALEAQYGMFAVSSRAAALEKKINDAAGKSLLIWESKLSHRYWWEPKHNDQYWWQWQSPLKGVKYPSKYLIAYMIVVIILALFAVPLFSVYAFWDNSEFGATAWGGRILIFINFVYSIASLVFIFQVAPSVLWRMKGAALSLAYDVSSEAERDFGAVKRSASQSESE